MVRPLNAVGMMSGTSLDGVDVALLTTDGSVVARMGPARTYAYDPEFRARLRGILGGQGPVAQVERDLTDFHGQVLLRFLSDHDIDPKHIDLVGFHGHTILHRPDQRRTWQIGNGGDLASMVGIPVISDFRSADVLTGGQGAPLVPVFHQALAKSLTGPVAVLNIGGVANVTWIGPSQHMLAFDTGPGNALLDDWVLRHTGQFFDQEGRLAAAGTVHPHLVQTFLSHDYFAKAAPKSLDRDDFARLACDLVSGLSVADGAATLSAFTVAAVALAQDHFPHSVQRWLVTGGGRHNQVLMAALAAALPMPVQAVEAVGWDGDALEALAFGFLAVRSHYGLPLTFPETTGSPRPMTGGRLHLPEGTC